MATKTRRIPSLLLAVLLILAAALPAWAEDSVQSVEAAAMQLMRTEGTVAVTNNTGRALSTRDDMRLYNGYHVSTQAASYAWISLDSEKLTKLDAVSEAELRKSGKVLELLLNSGNLFFNVTSPLAEDETLNIRTSTMVVGIRGTSGWIKVSDRWSAEIYVLEGSVECSVADPVTGQVKTATIQSGEKAVAMVYPQDQAGDKCDILLGQYEADDIDGFALVELAGDPALCEKIFAASGMDILGALGADRQAAPEAAQETVQEAAQQRLEQDQQTMQGILDDIAGQLAQQENNVSTGSVWEREDSSSAPEAPPVPEAPAQPEPPSPSSSSGVSSDGSSSDRDPSDDHQSSGGSSSDRNPSDSSSSSGSSSSEASSSGESSGESGETSSSGESSSESSEASSSSESSSSSEPEPEPEPVAELKMPLTSAQVQVYLNYHGAGSYTLQASETSSQNLLTVDSDLAIAAGITLDLDSGINILVKDGSSLIVDGTLTMDGNLENLGTVTVNSSDTFRLNVISNHGALENSADGHIVTTNGITALTGSTADNYGIFEGDIVLYGGDFNMKGGTVYGFVGAQPNGGTFTITDGEVICPPDYDGIATIDCKFGNLILTGGIITNNNEGGYALSVSEQAVLTMGNTLVRAKKKYLCLINGGELEPPYYGLRYDNSGGYYFLVPADYSGERGNLLWDLTEATGAFTVSGIGSIPDDTSDGSAPWTYVRGFFKTVTVADGITGIGDFAFASCSNLEKVIIPDSVTCVGSYAFSSCSNLAEVNIPDSVETIGSSAFANCTGLTKVSLPNGLKTIAENTFSNCTSLNEVFIPNSIETIERDIFMFCDALTDIYYGGSPEDWEQITINDTNLDPPPGTIIIHYNESGLP